MKRGSWRARRGERAINPQYLPGAAGPGCILRRARRWPLCSRGRPARPGLPPGLFVSSVFLFLPYLFVCHRKGRPAGLGIVWIPWLLAFPPTSARQRRGEMDPAALGEGSEGGFWSFFYPSLPISKVQGFTQTEDFRAGAGWGRGRVGTGSRGV